MNIYRCVFLDDNAEAKAIEAMDVGDLEHAIDLAIEMLKGRPHYRAVEVWRGGKRLYTSAHSESEPDGPAQ